MKRKLIIINSLCLLLISSLALADEQLKVEDLMTYRQFKAAGLNKQTPEEINALNDWLNSFVGQVPKSVVSTQVPKAAVSTEVTEERINQIIASPELLEEKINKVVKENRKKNLLKMIGSSKIPYKIQRVKGKILKINNRDFEMVRTCDGFNAGDEVKLIKGNVHGICDEATFEHTESGERCHVYCERDE